MEIENIGQLIKRRRKVLGLTINDLAYVTNLSKKTIMQIENGIRNPTFKVLQNILDYLNLEMKVELKKGNE